MKKTINWKKVLNVTIFLGLFLQVLASLIFSYISTEESSWSPFYVERCRASCNNTIEDNLTESDPTDDPWGIKNLNCDSYCQKHLSFGFFPYLSQDKGFNYNPGFNPINLLQNIIIWHGLAFMIGLFISKEKKNNLK